MSMAAPTSLNKTQKRKVSPAAKFVLSSHYQGELKVPKWSDIGTLVQRQLREDVVQRLRDTDSGDVAEYLNVRHDELEKYIHQRVRSMREARNCNGLKGRGEKGPKETLAIATKPRFASAADHPGSDFREFTGKTDECGMDLTTSSESSPLTGQWNETSLHAIPKEQDQPRLSHQPPSYMWSTTQPWHNEGRRDEIESTGRKDYLDAVQTSQVFCTSSASNNNGDGIRIQPLGQHQSNLSNLAYRGIDMRSSFTSDTHHLDLRPGHRLKTHRDLEKVEELHDEAQDPRCMPDRFDSKKRKRILSHEDERMKLPITQQKPLDIENHNVNAVSGGAITRRFCYICESVRCHHTIKEQASSPKTLSHLSISEQHERFIDANTPRDIYASIRGQRRHTTEISHQSMHPLARTATEPRRSLQIESRSMSSQLLLAPRLGQHLGIPATPIADSGYSTGTLPGTRISPVAKYDVPSDDEEARKFDVLRTEPARQRRPSVRGAAAHQGAYSSPSPQKSPFQLPTPFPLSPRRDHRNLGGLTISEECSPDTADQSSHQLSSREVTPCS